MGRDPVVFIAGGHGPMGDELAPLDRDAARAAIEQHAGAVEAWALAALYLVMRTVGKVTGGYLAVKTVGADIRAPGRTGMGLLSQGGMAVASSAAQSMAGTSGTTASR